MAVPAPSRSAKTPRIANIAKLTSMTVEEVRVRVHAAVIKLPVDQLPPKEIIEALEILTKCVERQAKVWLSMRDAAAKAARGLTGRQLDDAIAKAMPEIERYVAVAMPDDAFARMVEARESAKLAAETTALTTTREQPQPDPNDFAEGDPETWQ